MVLISFLIWAVSTTLIYIKEDVLNNLKIILFEPGWFSFGSLFKLLPEIMISVICLSLESLAAIGIFHLILCMFK